MLNIIEFENKTRSLSAFEAHYCSEIQMWNISEIYKEVTNKISKDILVATMASKFDRSALVNAGWAGYSGEFYFSISTTLERRQDRKKRFQSGRK